MLCHYGALLPSKLWHYWLIIVQTFVRRTLSASELITKIGIFTFQIMCLPVKSCSSICKVFLVTLAAACTPYHDQTDQLIKTQECDDPTTYRLTELFFLYFKML